MAQYYYVIREKRCNVVVQKPLIRHQQQEDHVKLMTRSDEFPELYHLDMPTHQWEDHYRSSRSNTKDTSYGGGGCGWSTMKPAGKHYPAPPHHQVNVCQGPVAAQVQNRVFAPPQCQDEKVFYYSGNHPTQPSPPRQMKKPTSETVIDSNEAARRYGGILIKDFGRW